MNVCCRSLQGDFARAASHCRRVLELKPHHFGAADGLALCAIELRDLKVGSSSNEDATRTRWDHLAMKT